MAKGMAWRGYTLIELLVVIVILSILTSIVFTTIAKPRAKTVENEVRKLHALINLIEEESIFLAQDMGVSFDVVDSRYAYSFFKYNHRDRQWDQFRESSFRPRELSADLSVNINISNQTAAPNPDDASLPQLLFFSTGEKSIFSIEVIDERDASAGYLLSSDGFNTTQLRTPSQQGKFVNSDEAI